MQSDLCLVQITTLTWQGHILPNLVYMPEKIKNDKGSRLQWVGKKISESPEFLKATAILVFENLTGMTVSLFNKSENDQHYLTLLFERSIKRWVAADYNLKVLVLELILSPYFSAKNVQSGSPLIELPGITDLMNPGEIYNTMLDHSHISIPFEKNYLTTF